MAKMCIFDFFPNKGLKTVLILVLFFTLPVIMSTTPKSTINLDEQTPFASLR